MTSVEGFLSWQTLARIIALYCVAPYTVLWLVVRCWPKDHDRRNEYLAEYDVVPMWRRPFWVADAAIRSVLDGPTARWARRDEHSAGVTVRQAVAGRTIAVIVAGFVLLGLVMVFSATSATQAAVGRSPYTIFNRQLMWAVLGLLALVIALLVPYQRWRTLVIPGATFAVWAMMLPFAPGLGVTIAGTRSWVRVGSFGFQPAEFLKLAVIAFLADYFARHQKDVHVPRHGICPVAVVGVWCIGTSLIQGVPGEALVLGLVILVVGVIAGVPVRHIGSLAVVGAVGAAVMFVSGPRRYRPSTGFDGFETNKEHPLAPSDFIFAVITDDLGLIGSVAVLGGFALLAGLGVQIALAAPDRFGMILAGGITAWFGVQAIVNLAAVAGIMPAMRLALPFFSVGGTSLYTSMGAVGLLLNVGREVRQGPGCRSVLAPASSPA